MPFEHRAPSIVFEFYDDIDRYKAISAMMQLGPADMLPAPFAGLKWYLSLMSAETIGSGQKKFTATFDAVLEKK